MDTMAERLAAALLDREMTAPDLIAATRQRARKKLSRATIYFILDGTTKPEKIRAGTVETICRILKIRREWLLWGTPPMSADTDEGQTHDVRAATAPEFAELQLVTGLIAQALAASIQPAGKALLDALEKLPKAMKDREFLQDVMNVVAAELPNRASERPVPKRAGRKHQ
jgi:DNA-binding Xre family transcriptional regulator